MVRGPKGLYTQTADGVYDPATGKYGETVMLLNPKDMRLMDSYTPANWPYLNSKDLDLGSANPVVFPFQKWTIVASAAKESVITLLNGDDLGGADHHTPMYQSSRWGNDEVLLAGRGLWGAMATWQDAPKFKSPYGAALSGTVMAFEVTVDPGKGTPMLIPTWMSRVMHVPDPP